MFSVLRFDLWFFSPSDKRKFTRSQISLVLLLRWPLEHPHSDLLKNLNRPNSDRIKHDYLRRRCYRSIVPHSTNNFKIKAIVHVYKFLEKEDNWSSKDQCSSFEHLKITWSAPNSMKDIQSRSKWPINGIATVLAEILLSRNHANNGTTALIWEEEKDYVKYESFAIGNQGRSASEVMAQV